MAITAERKETKESNGRSEFVYGSLLRTVPLPSGADSGGITASYNKGIGTVSVGVSDVRHVQQRIPVRTAT